MPAVSDSERSRANLLVTGATLAALLVVLAGGDRIPQAAGLGYDGVRYGRWVRELSLPVLLAPQRERPPGLFLSDYSVRRVLPSMLLHYALRLAGIPRSGANALWAFVVLNLLALGLGVYLWCRAADELGVPSSGKWLGWIGLVASYANLKMPVYYPALTDSTAFCIGAASLLFFLRRRFLAQLCLIGVGAFVWPTLPYFGVLLAAFPRPLDPAPSAATPRAATVVAATVSIGALAFTAWLVVVGYEITTTPVRPLTELVSLSALVVTAFLFFALRPLFDASAFWRELDPRRILRRPQAWIAALVFAAAALAPAAIDTQDTAMGLRKAISDSFYSSITQPAVFALAHALYFGPALLLLVPLWPRIAASVRRQGPGLVLCFALAVVLGAGSESRKLVNFLPFAVLFLVSVAAAVDLRPRRLVTLLVVSLFFSKVWLPMDRPLDVPGLGPIAWRKLYVSSRGPWIDHTWYAAQLPFVLAMGWLAWRWTRPPWAQTGRESTSAKRSL